MSSPTLPLRENVPAVITAGGRLQGTIAEAAGVTVKALAPVAGRPLLLHVLRALDESGRVGPRIVVGPVADLESVVAAERRPGLRVIAEGETGPENIRRGLGALGDGAGDGWTLLVPCDLPFLDGASIRWLLDNAPEDADIVFPILTKAEYDAVLPGSSNTYARLAGEEYTGGSIFLVRPAAIARNRRLIELVFEARKSQIAMARLLGPPSVLRFLMGRLTVAQAEERASVLTGCRCRVLPHAPAPLAADVDTLEDYRFAERALAASAPAEQGEPRATKPLLRPNGHFEGALNEARQRAQEARQRARELAREAQDRMREAQEKAREAQEKAIEQARARALEAQERARKAAEAMPPGLLMRITSSMIGIPALVILVFSEGSPQYPAIWFTFAVAICAVLGTLEYFRGLRLRGFQPNEPLAIVAVVLLQFAAWNVSRNRVTAFLPALIALLVIGTLIYEVASHEKEPLANIGVTFLGVVYVGWLFSYLIFLRSLPGNAAGFLPAAFQQLLSLFHLPPPTLGAWIVLYVIAVTWSTDAGAYFVGMRFGKRKLAPRLSPKKTLEGAIGGIVASTLMSFAWGLGIGLPWWHCAILGPSLSILGQVGDLCESALKRDIGVKDFGMVLPGHGGILDRFDSLLFTAPVAYYYLQFFVVHALK